KGAASGAEHSLLARKRQLRDLDLEVQRLSASVDTEQAEVAALSTSVARGREQITEIAKSVQARLADRLAGEKDLERAAQEHERGQRHLETISSDPEGVVG